MELLSVISDILSVITITLCFVLKFPQIINLYKLKSANGISIFGLLLELSSYTITASYNYVNKYALLSYMEYPVIIIQEYILIFLVLKYSNLINTKSIGITAFYSAITLSFLFQVLPAALLTYMIPFCTPVSLSSKVMQLYAVLSTGKADSVSVTTWLISAFTNFTRVFTIYMDSADIILLTNFSLSTILGVAIATSTIVLNKRNREIEKETKKE